MKFLIQAFDFFIHYSFALPASSDCLNIVATSIIYISLCLFDCYRTIEVERYLFRLRINQSWEVSCSVVTTPNNFSVQNSPFALNTYLRGKIEKCEVFPIVCL